MDTVIFMFVARIILPFGLVLIIGEFINRRQQIENSR